MKRSSLAFLAGLLLSPLSALLAAEAPVAMPPVGAGSPITVAGADELKQSFATPPASARPWVFSYCDNGNLTSNGITADLEAMHRAGLGGLMFFDVSHGAPKSPIEYASPQWRGLFKHLCSEADRLGLQVSINNDAGWSGSGGPWITPELSMQKLTTSETLVEGGRRFEGALPQPPMLANFYRDVAVLAFPTPAGEDVKMRDRSPKVTSSVADLKTDLQQLVEGGPTTKVGLPLPTPDHPVWVQVEFPQPFMARTVLVSAQAGGSWWQLNAHGKVQVSDDGQNFRTVADFHAGPPAPSPGPVAWLQAQLNAGGVTARWFRIVFTQYTKNNLVELEEFPLEKIELTSALRLADIAGKAAFSPKHGGPSLGATFPISPAAALIPRAGILDITTKLSADGKLSWDVPPGKWTILRIGHTSTGKQNEPSSKIGKGLECDKLCKAGIEAHFAGLMAKVVADNQPLVGKTLVRTHADSWECGSQNWTPKFREEFRRLRGYDPLPLLPVVTGRIVDNNEISERFLWDFRQTISDLLIENYARRFRELSHQHGLQLSLEAYGSVPADDMTYAGQADEPMGEFWSWEKYVCTEACTEMVSAAHVYGRKIIGAEAFTGSDQEKWQSHPGNIKDLGDWAFCEGINRFVFHRSSMQPWGDPAPAPGLSCGPYGLHYDRTQTWWEQSRAWHDYVARCQFMLQRGLFVADLCVLNPEGPQGNVVLSSDVRPNPLDRGAYNFDGCPPDVVLTRISVKDGKLVLPDGMSYRVLVLPQVQTMTPKLLRKIKELVDAGATVVGHAKPPQKSPSLEDHPNCDTEVKKLAAELWNSGKIVTGMTAAQLLAKRGVPPDFTADRHLRYIHRCDGDTEIYFVANPETNAVDALCSFRVTGKQPELWSPDTGHMGNASVFEQQDGVMRVPLRFDPCGSVFVVFRKAVSSQAQAAAGRNWLEFAPAQEISGAWAVSFDPKWGPFDSAQGRRPGEFTFDKLEDWSKRGEAGIRYYSGTAVYRKTFALPDSKPNTQNSRLFLDLGQVAVMAEVKLNGKDLGILWKPPFRVEITDAVKTGDNRLEVKVVNLWINRMIGDEQLPEDSDRNSDAFLRSWPSWLTEGKPNPAGRFTFANNRLWKKGDALAASGLIGPVKILTALLLASNGGRSVAAEPARPLMGAIRWDAWHQAPPGDAHAPVLAMERSLGPAPYQHRLPFFATVVSGEQVRVNGYTPAIIEREIAFAKAGGLDYWAFLLYETNSTMSQALALYLASPRQADISFCAIAQFANFAKEPARLVGMMAKTNYVRVAGGRPLLYAFRIGQEQIQTWGGPEKAKAVFDRLRADAVAAGCANPYIVVMNEGVAESASIAKAIGADAISDYAVSGHGGKNGSPYSELTQAARNYWQQAAGSGARVVPLAMSGWDRRPRIEHPVPWEKYQQPGVGMERYFQSPTPTELAVHIGEAMTWVDEHPQHCPARAVLIYAWNEHDEGGWLCPTRGAGGSPDASRLDALSAMLSKGWKK